MKIPLYQIDAFSSRVFGGNPAAVCPLERWFSDDALQSIALENNLSETAFFVGGNSQYEIRWFTPEAEVDLCGHATLATGYVISEILGDRSKIINFTSASGELQVNLEKERPSLNFPSRPGIPIECPDLIYKALGHQPSACISATDFMVVLESSHQVQELNPNLDLLKEFDARGVLVTAKGDDCDFVSRCFFPRLGVPEDPVTGSAHCTLAPYWAERLGKQQLHCRQVSKRAGELWCEVLGDRVLISGDCALYLTGEVTLPSKYNNANQ